MRCSRRADAGAQCSRGGLACRPTCTPVPGIHPNAWRAPLLVRLTGPSCGCRGGAREAPGCCGSAAVWPGCPGAAAPSHGAPGCSRASRSCGKAGGSATRPGLQRARYVSNHHSRTVSGQPGSAGRDQWQVSPVHGSPPARRAHGLLCLVRRLQHRLPAEQRLPALPGVRLSSRCGCNCCRASCRSLCIVGAVLQRQGLPGEERLPAGAALRPCRVIRRILGRLLQHSRSSIRFTILRCVLAGAGSPGRTSWPQAPPTHVAHQATASAACCWLGDRRPGLLDHRRQAWRSRLSSLAHLWAPERPVCLPAL